MRLVFRAVAGGVLLSTTLLCSGAMPTAGNESGNSVTWAGTSWPAVGGKWDNTRYSTLGDINRGTTQRLGGAWMDKLDPSGTISSVVVAGGRMFVTTGFEVFALDAASGHVIWKYRPVATPSRKGVAVGGGRVYVGLSNATMIAVDERTGRLLWTSMVGYRNWSGISLGSFSSRRQAEKLGRAGEMISSVPAYVRGRVIVGLANGDFGVRGRIVAVDAKTGARLWTFSVVPGPGRVGHDSWPGKSNVWKTGGGGVWMPPAVDPILGLVYLGTGNPVPQWGGELRAGNNLFTCSVVALDIKTGRLRWHFQAVHHDIWDSDLGTPLVLFDPVVHGHRRRAIAVMRTDGYLFQLDRRTGRPLYPIKELPVPQDARLKTSATQPFPVGMEPIGPRCVERSMVPAGFKLDCFFEPFDYGEPNVMEPLMSTRAAPMAYSPQTGYFYVTSAVVSYWVSRSRDPYFFQVRTVPEMKNYGLITALDPRTGEIVWQDRVPHRVEAGSGAMATAGGLVFHGAPNGELQAYDAYTGKLLWSFQTGASASGPVSTYMADGRQFVAIAAGDLWAFTLGGSIRPRPAPPVPPSETSISGPIFTTNTVTIGKTVTDMGLTGVHTRFDPYAFAPVRAAALPGTPIIWVNHSKFTDSIVAQDGSWRTGPIRPGQTATVVVRRAGTYTYLDERHPWSFGQIIIGQGSANAVSVREVALYRANCSACHGTDFTGREPAPALVGPEFLSRWLGHTVGELYTRIRTTMPLGRAGSLSQKEYLRIVTLLLKVNQVPLGEKPLAPKSREVIKIQPAVH